MTMQKKLEEWAKKTVKAYDGIASQEDVNLAYYTQSPLSNIVDNPELMIVGINPGSGGTYSDQRKNRNWKYLNKNQLDEKHLLEGNYCQEEGKPTSWENHKKWNYWSSLKRCFSGTNLPTIIDDDSKVIITNASFFNTPKANEIGEDLLKRTIPYTLELIQITNPKHLVFLSGEKCFGRLSRLADLKFEYKHVCGRIYIGKLNDRLCIGIPHPAYKTNEELNLVASIIPCLIKFNDYEELDVELIKKECSEQINAYQKRILCKKKSPTVVDQEEKSIYQNARNHLSENYSNNLMQNGDVEKSIKFSFGDFELYLILNDKPDKRLVGLRHRPFSIENHVATLDENYERLKQFITDNNYKSNKWWTAYKRFENYEGNTPEEVAHYIKSEIKAIIDIIKE